MILLSNEYLGTIPTIPVETSVDNFVSVEEAAFQTVCLQYIFFSKLRPLFNRVYGLLSTPRFLLSRLNRCIKSIVNNFTGDASLDCSFMFRDDNFIISNKLTLDDHQFIGGKIRLFMLEVIVVSAAIKDKLGQHSNLYILFKKLYNLLILLRNVLVDKLRACLNKCNLLVNWDEIYYLCSMSNIVNSFLHQQSMVIALSLEVNLKHYYNQLADATCLCDFP